MASWTNQSTSSLLPGEPWTSAKALAAFENPEAIAEGASGAPKILTAAMQPPTAGSNTIRGIQAISATYTSPASSANAELFEGSIVALVGGTVRVRSTVGTSGTVTSINVQYLKNGVAFATFTSTGTASADVAVVLGDQIRISATINGGGSTGTVSLSDIRVESGTSNFAVA